VLVEKVTQRQPVTYQSHFHVLLSDGKGRFNARPEPWLSWSHSIYHITSVTASATPMATASAICSFSNGIGFQIRRLTCYLAHCQRQQLPEYRFPSVTI
jgi:hypothetical protein